MKVHYQIDRFGSSVQSARAAKRDKGIGRRPRPGGDAASAENRHKAAIGAALVIMVSISLYLAFKKAAFLLDYRAALEGNYTVLFWQFCLLLNGGIFFWRLALYKAYQPAPTWPDKWLPSVTVIVPAYNEGRQVLDTLRSVAASDYPPEKLQIISVDDGSRDDTWSWMRRAEAELGSRIELLRLPVNQGKRRALYEGFKRSRGDVLVTIDSDSLIENRTLRHMVAPFCQDPQVGGVAGNVRVLNMSEGVIPRMLDVNFTYSFDFIRAGQSRINTVMCTPGALSAYRRDVIMPVIDEWLNQTFMGQAAAIGEDRALTNLILREGYHVHFAREAQVFTNVPVKFNGLCKMLLRWARSNVRENLVMSGFAFKHFRDTPALGARINLIMSWFGMTVGEVLKTMALLYLLAYPLTVGYGMIAGGTLAALFPGIFYIMRHRSSNFLYAFPYSIFWMFGLSWISLYALFTPQKSAWLTRDLPQTQMQTRRFAKPSEADYPAASVLGSLQPAPIPVMNVTYSRGVEDMRL